MSEAGTNMNGGSPGGWDANGRAPEQGAEGAFRALVVDDDRAVRRLVALVLERDGFSVVSAAGGRDAINLSERGEFDVVLLDVQMPGTDGWDVLEALCKRTAPPSAVVMSGHAPEAEALQRGAAALLRKPFSPGELLAAVHAAVHERGGALSAIGREPVSLIDRAGRAAAAGPLAA